MDEDKKDSPFIEELGGPDVEVEPSLPSDQLAPAATLPPEDDPAAVETIFPDPEIRENDPDRNDSPFIEEFGGADMAAEPISETDQLQYVEVPEAESDTKPDESIRHESEIRYLLERAEDSENALAHLRRQTGLLKIVGLFVLAIFAACFIELKDRNAKQGASLSALAAWVAGRNVSATDLSRINTLPGSTFPVLPVYFVTWSQGEPPIQLIKQNEGFCFLTGVTGHFQGAGESVRVWIDKDGYWYLGGASQQQGISGQCAVMRY